MKSICFGLIFVFFCSGDATVTKDFCIKAGPDIQKLKSMTREELASLSRVKKEALLSLRTTYKRECK